MKPHPDLQLLKDTLFILTTTQVPIPVFGARRPREEPLSPIPYVVAQTTPQEPLEGPESPFEAFRGEGWCDDILLPPPGPITPVPPCSEGPSAPGEPPVRCVHPTMVCDECGDTQLVLSHQPGEEGWFRCTCGILHQPHELRQEIPPLASGELPEGFSPTTHM
jgi:hypothetical protein